MNPGGILNLTKLFFKKVREKKETKLSPLAAI